MVIIKWLVSLADKPRSLNVALFCLGIAGMVWAYNKGQDRIGELEADMKLMQKEFRHEKDSLFRVSQVAEALCNERVLDGQRELINRLDALNGDLNEQLGRKSSADEKRMQQANVNATVAKKNTVKLRKLNEAIEKQK